MLTMPMLTLPDIQDALARITYRPDWTFTARQGAVEGDPTLTGGLHFTLTAAVPDAFRPGETCTLDVHSNLPPMPDTDSLYRWVLHRVLIMETHEARELFRVAGKVWDSPHRTHADRDEAH